MDDTETQLQEVYRAFVNPENYGFEANGRPKQPPVLYSIMEILNFYEQLALGIRDDDMDETVVSNTIAPLIERFFTKVKPYIREIAWRGSHYRYEHLRWLMNKWNWERQRGTRGGLPVRAAIDPSNWDSSYWIEEGDSLKWGTDGVGAWGKKDVDSWLNPGDEGGGDGADMAAG